MTRTMSVVFGITLFLMTVSCAQSDAAITGTIKTKMAADETVGSLQIDVDTADGIVTLTGNIDDTEAKERALAIARETGGVKDVVDMITVRRAGGTGDAPMMGGMADAGITMEVKSRLLADPVVKGLDIDVDTREQVVYLTGTVTTVEERDHAIELVEEMENVKEVQANLKLEKPGGSTS